MKIQKVSDKYSISRDEHGSWFIYENKEGSERRYKFRGPLPSLIDLHHEHDETGEVCASMEYPSLIDLHSTLCSLGECGNAVMNAANFLLEGEA